MFIGVLKASLYLSEPQSLKDKRRVIKGLCDRIKNKFNMAVAQTGSMDSWNNSELGIVCVSNAASHADSMLSSVVNFIETQGTVELTFIQTEIIPFS
jgi:uncharacterized protein YlxP (DUF503 family)